MGNIYWGTVGALHGEDLVNAPILLLGDSWFWYPLDNLANEVAAAMPGQQFVVIGNNGAEAAEWGSRYRKEIDFAFKMFAQSAKALLLSGGGNDIAGMHDFLQLIRDNCSNAKTFEDCYRVAQPDTALTTIIGAYRSVITKFRGYNKKAPVLMHNYDYAWPTGKGLFGPADWLKAPMDKAQVPAICREPLLRDVLDGLHDEQQALCTEPKLGRLLAVKTTGTLPVRGEGDPQWWANELHPTPEGFKLLARDAIVPALRAEI